MIIINIIVKDYCYCIPNSYSENLSYQFSWCWWFLLVFKRKKQQQQQQKKKTTTKKNNNKQTKNNNNNNKQTNKKHLFLRGKKENDMHEHVSSACFKRTLSFFSFYFKSLISYLSACYVFDVYSWFTCFSIFMRLNVRLTLSEFCLYTYRWELNECTPFLQPVLFSTAGELAWYYCAAFNW